MFHCECTGDLHMAYYQASGYLKRTSDFKFNFESELSYFEVCVYAVWVGNI